MAQKIDIGDFRDHSLKQASDLRIDIFQKEGNSDGLLLIADSLNSNLDVCKSPLEQLYQINVIADYFCSKYATDKSIEILQKSVRNFSFKNDSIDIEYAYSLHLLAYSYYQRNDFNRRLEYDLRAAAIFEQLGNNEILLSHAYNSIVVGYLSTRQLEKGYDAYRKAQRYSRKCGHHYYVYENLVAMGNALNFYEPSMAQQYLLTAGDYFDLHLSDSIDQTAYFYIILGSVHTALNKHQEAKEFYLKGLDTYYKNKENRPYFESIFNYYLGVSEKFLDNYEQALAYHDTAIHIINSKLNGRESMCVGEYRQKGEIFMLMKQYDSAIVYLDKAYEISYKERGDDPYYTLANLSKKSRVFMYAQQYGKAVTCAQQVIYSFVNQPVPDNHFELPEIDSIDLRAVHAIVEALTVKAHSLSLSSDHRDSTNLVQAVMDCYSTAERVFDIVSYQNVLVNSGLNTSRLNRSLVNYLIDFVYDYKEKISDQDLCQIWEILSRSKAHQLTVQKNKMQLSEKERTYLYNEKLKHKQKRLYQISDSLSFLEKDFGNPNYLKLRENYLVLCLDIFMDTYKLSNKKELDSEQFVDSKSFIQMSDIIGKDQMYVDYYLKDNKLLTFIIHDRKLEMATQELPKNFEQLVQNKLRAIKSGNKLKLSPSDKLSDLLLSDITAHFHPVKNICISPDKNLWKLPFEVLTPFPNHKKTLIEIAPVSYAYSTSLLNSKDETIEASYDLLLMAPGFESENTDIKRKLAYRDILDIDSVGIWKTNTLKPLPFSIAEIKKIEKLARKHHLKCKTYYNEEATKENFLKDYSQGKIVHLSTHGLASKTNPEESGLFFYQDVDNIGESYLIMNELFQTHSNANLVVLSACQTGYGKVMNGEGVMALPRGFLHAGVPNVICSLWKVHDQKTMKFMKLFYENLFEDLTYSKALQQTKIEMIQKGELPVDWSGIIQIGIN